jgi:hypothetical protein
MTLLIIFGIGDFLGGASALILVGLTLAARRGERDQPAPAPAPRNHR